ncbi:hypothetical protein L596_000753 [Steinernema carpocapsae]|uniref:Uncharacterized protein n=1 Tax=Steinernema carpocapsae TaxID=34508 RepID=A0A4U8UN93_STECR|nr:hypothetical protein L596_000753 [Steinernema carpocapsae]
MSAHFRLQPTNSPVEIASKGRRSYCTYTYMFMWSSADLPQTFVVSCSRCWRPSHVGLILSSPDWSARSLPNKSHV